MRGVELYRILPGQVGKPVPIFRTDFEKDSPRVSPDGKWIAYSALESGRWEVYVASFPEFTNRRQVSRDGAVQPVWRRDQKELYFLTLDGKLMAATVHPGIEAGTPRHADSNPRSREPHKRPIRGSQ